MNLFNDKTNLSALLTAICHCLLELEIIQLMIFAALYINYKLKTAVQASCRMILASADAACIVYIWQKTEANLVHNVIHFIPFTVKDYTPFFF